MLHGYARADRAQNGAFDTPGPDDQQRSRGDCAGIRLRVLEVVLSDYLGGVDHGGCIHADARAGAGVPAGERTARISVPLVAMGRGAGESARTCLVPSR
jgi:hypothetical protein